MNKLYYESDKSLEETVLLIHGWAGSKKSGKI